MEIKQNIRKQVFLRRKQALPEKVVCDSQQIAKKLYSLDLFTKSDCIYAYMDCKKEVMTGEIIEKAWEQGKKVAIPRVSGNTMEFYYITDFSQVEKGYFGILEPKQECPLAQEENACLLMPGVAFDEHKNRVGYGGGFYDRFLSTRPSLLRIALAFEFQIFNEVPFEATDILPEVLITEKRTIF